MKIKYHPIMIMQVINVTRKYQVERHHRELLKITISDEKVKELVVVVLVVLVVEIEGMKT